MKHNLNRAGWLLSAAVLWAVSTAATAQSTEDAGNLARGKRLFMRCAACHDATAASSAKIGPTMHALIGRQAGAFPGYKFSGAMQAQTFVWDVQQLEAWLIKPTALVPGTSMAFAGMPDAGERKALIQYLQSLR